PGRSGKFRRRRARDRVKLLSGLIHSDARPQPPHHAQVMSPLPALKWQRRVVLQKRPDLRRGEQDILERAWHYADDGKARVIERDLAADDRGVAAEAPAPQPVAEDRHSLAIGTVVR